MVTNQIILILVDPPVFRMLLFFFDKSRLQPRHKDTGAQGRQRRR